MSMSKLICRDCIVDFKQNIMNMLICTIEKKDTYTLGHSKRVAMLSQLIGEAMGLSIEELSLLYESALMHDLGKIHLEEDILQKKRKLTINEYEKVKVHSSIGWEMLKEIQLFKEHATIVRHHHERYDGTGYPDKLKKKNIPLYSRVIAIADAFDAMISLRDYQKNLTIEQALKELENHSDTQFDSELVPVAIKTFKNYFFYEGK